METTFVTEFYRAAGAAERKKLLEQSVQAEEEPEKNGIREELFSLRYQQQKSRKEQEPIDALLRVWMTMELNRNTGSSFFGRRSARKEMLKMLEQVQLLQTAGKSSLHKELLYEECCHAVRLYVSLCEKDRNYRNLFMGVMQMSDEKVREKLKRDLYTTAVLTPKNLDLETELALFTQAAEQIYTEYFPNDPPLRKMTEMETR